ncbi:hypothetical protein GCM10018952_46180 [Streptosporangium vulgare]
MLAGAGRGDQVERAGLEAVRGTGERAHRADLHGVAGEVGLERASVGGGDLLLGPALEEVDERVSGDLVGEADAARALDAALTVEQHLGGERDRLVEGPLLLHEAALALAVGHGLVLQRALAALVADRAVERVVQEQQLHHAALRLLGDRGGELGLHDHALGDLDRAGGLRLGEAPAVAGVGDVHQALAAVGGRLQQRVVAEPGDLDAEQLGRPDDQSALRDAHLEAVDGDGDQVHRHLLRRGGGFDGHGVSSVGLMTETVLCLPVAWVRALTGHPTPWTGRDRTGSRRSRSA